MDNIEDKKENIDIMENKNDNLKNDKERRIGILILLILYLITLGLFFTLLFGLNVLPIKYLTIIIAFSVIVSLVLFFFSFRKKTKKKGRVIIGVILFILIASLLVGSYFLGRTIVFLDRMSKEDTTETLDYYILVKEGSSLLPERETIELSKNEKFLLFLYPEKEDGSDKPYVLNIENLKESLEEKEIGTVISKDDNYSIAKGRIKEKLNTVLKYEEDEKTLYDKLIDGTYDYILISASSYEILNYEEKNLQETTDILYIEKNEKIEERVEGKEIDILNDSYTILLSGSDFYGAFADDTIHRSDVDMLITVNPRTNKVFLTAIPRDYFVKLHSYGEYDKLTHSSLKGIGELEKTLEDTFEINIDYYFRVNFNGVIDFINAIGGIDVISERDFYAQVDSGYKMHVREGENHLNGSETLAFARERYSFADGSTSSLSEGDLQRIRNQQIVIEAILKKATSSTTILSNYASILDSLGREVETNISREDIAKVIKNQLNKMPAWDISKYSIASEYGWEICYLAPYYGELCVAYQDPVQNAYVRDEIIRIMNEE